MSCQLMLLSASSRMGVRLIADMRPLTIGESMTFSTDSKPIVAVCTDSFCSASTSYNTKDGDSSGMVLSISLSRLTMITVHATSNVSAVPNDSKVMRKGVPGRCIFASAKRVAAWRASQAPCSIEREHHFKT